jgi:hypothetical protein
MMSVDSHGSSTLPFMMQVLVGYFVSISHEVITALIVGLPPEVSLWRFLCNLIDILCSWNWYDGYSFSLLDVFELASLMAEFSHYCRSCDRNLVVGECLAYNIPIARSWWSPWGCYGMWLMPYMLLLKVPEHANDQHCHSSCTSILSCGLVISSL